MPDSATGLLLIVSGPSGSGKSTLVRQLLDRNEFPFTFSVSATSRPPRPGEVNGEHYHFWSRDQFEQMSACGDFLEFAEVHGEYYGTPRAPVEEALAAGRWIILEIDVQGFQQVKQKRPDAVSFFIRTPSLELYESRLRDRGTESEDHIQRRVAQAKRELAAAASYDYQIVNESLPQAVNTLQTLLRGVQITKGLHHA